MLTEKSNTRGRLAHVPRDYATEGGTAPTAKTGWARSLVTPDCLTAALVTHILPSLLRAPVWEPAAGDGALVRAIEATGCRILAGDIGSGHVSQDEAAD